VLGGDQCLCPDPAGRWSWSPRAQSLCRGRRPCSSWRGGFGGRAHGGVPGRALVGPAVDIARVRDVDLDRPESLSERLRDGKIDNGRVLTELEAEDPDAGSVRDC
jgi:hypothetical protein